MNKILRQDLWVSEMSTKKRTNCILLANLEVTLVVHPIQSSRATQGRNLTVKMVMKYDMNQRDGGKKQGFG